MLLKGKINEIGKFVLEAAPTTDNRILCLGPKTHPQVSPTALASCWFSSVSQPNCRGLAERSILSSLSTFWKPYSSPGFKPPKYLGAMNLSLLEEEGVSQGTREGIIWG